MAQALHAFPLALAVLLSGCTWLNGESTGVDKSAYDGGIGFALVVENEAEDAFDVTFRILGVGNAELASHTERLEPGERVEKWWSLKDRSTFSARFAYTWTGSTGATSHGFDDRTFDAQECPQLSRMEWELRQVDQTVGHAFLGKTCVAAD